MAHKTGGQPAYAGSVSPPVVDPTGPLSEFIANLTYNDLPERVRRRVRLMAVDAIANAFAGWQTSEISSIRSLGEALGGKGSSTVIGGPSLSHAGAIVLNAYLITAVSACDVYRPALCHVTPEVIPPALCIAEQIQASGEQLLLALVAGFETTVRLGLGLHYPVFRSRGWHSPGVIGPFGGAAAVGKLLGLDAGRLRNALGLAGSQASGTFAAFGSAAVKFHQAHGALAGYTAGILAAENFKTTGEILTHPDGGLLNVMSDGGDPAPITAGLGEYWELENISLRLWPTAAALQSVINALMALIQRYDLKPQDVHKIQISLPPASYEMNGAMGWDNRLSARLSARFVTSVVLHDRACWLDQFDNNHLSNSEIVNFARTKVEVDRDPSIAGDGAKVVISTSSGHRFVEQRAYAKGDPSDPLSENEVRKKLLVFGAPVLGGDRMDRIYDLTYHLESLGNIRPLCVSLRNPEIELHT